MSIFTQNFTMNELTNSLKKCKLKKAPGPDEISNEMLVQLSTAREYYLKSSTTLEGGVLR